MCRLGNWLELIIAIVKTYLIFFLKYDIAITWERDTLNNNYKK